MESETNVTQETQFVFRRLEEALHLFGRESDPKWFWIFVLAVVLAAGFVYVVWMYKRDSQSVGWPWAAFLAGLRCTVYAILAAVFLLPAIQTWEKMQTRSKVVMTLDVSGSMGNKDDMPTETMPAEKLPSRQDKVIQFLTDEQAGFLSGLCEKNPIYVYRFGSRADEIFRVFDKDNSWSTSEWLAWLKPDPKALAPEGASDEEKAKFQKRQELHQQLVGGTNLGNSLLEVTNRESNNLVQGLIVISDGRSTQYIAQAFDELRARARHAKVPIFTVVVGEHRQPISIRIADLQAPKQARPDDKLPVRVEVDGDGLPNQEKVVYLDVTSPKGDKRTLEKALTFNAGLAGPPHAQAEFSVDPAELGVDTTGAKRPELEEGEWVFRARIPRDKREVFLEKEHVSNQATVQVIKKPLRVLLFAGAASHDFQFIRNLLVREVDQRRAELSICLQLLRDGVVQDVPPERLLKSFPNRLGDDNLAEKADDRYYSLSQYDLIIAFDPDWTQLQPERAAALETWVSRQAGGLILVAGPVNTYQLSRFNNRDKVRPILDLFPVTLQDSVLQGLGVDRPTTQPWRIHFPGATADMEFLNLDEEAKDPMDGWEKFFTGKSKAEAGPDAPTVRGFYSYYPVGGVKDSAITVATFADPRARLRDGAKEQPYLVTMPYGSGKVVYLGSGESWRLRQYREIYHERFWTKLARYAGSGNTTRLSRRGVLVLGREYSSGQVVRFEAQLFGRDMLPLSAATTPKAQLKPPAGVAMPAVELKAKPIQGGEWNGWFQGQFRVTAPGEYRIELPIPEGGETLTEKFIVKESNPELDNTAPDFGQMYQLASEAIEVLPRMDKASQDQLKRALEGTAARLLQRVDEQSKGEAKPMAPAEPEPAAEPKEGAAANKNTLRLFFDLNSAKLIPKCMVTDHKIQRSRGPVKDLWDQGFTLSTEPSIRMATVLLFIATLLSVEWLTRKLLRLA
jgi:hypothetical protein